jgi:hypothetical protein
MIPYPVYKIVHILGIILLMSALGGAAVRAMVAGGEAARGGPQRLLAIFHGVGAFFILLGGFGMLARIGGMQGAFPGWVWAKIAVWILLGAALILPRRRPALARPVLFALPLLGGLAAYLAIYKPF